MCLLAALGIAIALTNIPRTVVTPQIDPSWGAVLAYAHHHGLQFGRDIVFTYGPLGYLFVQDFTGYDTSLRLMADFLLVYFVSAGACLLAWRMPLGWRLFLLGFFVASPANFIRGPDLLFPVGLLCWGLLCLTERERNRATVYELLLALMVAVLSLVKFTFVIEGGITLCAVAAERFLRGERRAPALLVGSCAALFLLGWLALGQQVSGVWKYAVNSWAVAKGYDLVMVAPAMREVRMGGIAVAILTVMALFVRTLTARDANGPLPRPRRALLFAWLLLLAMVSWKHGYVRGDHVAIFLGFACILILSLESIPSGTALVRQWTRVSAVVVCLLACTTLEWSFPGVMDRRFDQVFARFSANLRTLIRPSTYKERMAEMLGEERARNQLPLIRQRVGRASVDIFGHEQAYALFNDFSYRPRPVFQSYCAYSARLTRLNDEFYRGPEAPDYVLFTLSPLDGHLPTIEDSRALVTILARYKPVSREANFLLLARTNSALPTLSLISEGTAKPGEPVRLPDDGSGELWMEISLESSWLGLLQEFFYAPPQVKLSVQSQNGVAESYRTPAPMLRAGFLLSPLVHNNADVLDWYAGKELLRPSAVSVELGAQEKMFRGTFRYRFYRFEGPLGPMPKSS